MKRQESTTTTTTTTKRERLPLDNGDDKTRQAENEKRSAAKKKLHNSRMPQIQFWEQTGPRNTHKQRPIKTQPQNHKKLINQKIKCNF